VLSELGKELEKYSFPTDEDDAVIVGRLGLAQPLPTIDLKAPQLLVHYFGLTHPRFIMSYDKGMGKTIAYLSVLYATEPTKVVIVCSENAKLAQRREIQRHLDRWKMSWVFVEGQKHERQKAWNDLSASVYVCTYDTLLADMGRRAKSSGTRICPSWVDARSTHMAFDEWHRKLRNKGSAIWTLLKGFNNERMIFSSGSAGGKGVHSMWAVLHLCDKARFNAYWPYVMRHSHIEETYFGKKLSGCKDVAKWRREVAPYIFHRRKDLKDYPPKTRQALEVRMEPWQKKAHDQLLKQLIMELPDGEYFASPNTLAATMRLRQFLVCPRVIDPAFGPGAGLQGILADAQDSELSHFVISTPFRDPIPHIRQFFEAEGIRVWELVGGTKVDEIARRIEEWTKNGGVMVQTIQFAESYELPAARVMYMLGFLYDPEQNSQAEDRIHRDIRVTPHPVDIYYVKNLFSYEEDIAEAMGNTADNLHQLMHRPLSEFLK
jgi:hypothetical protein